MKKTMLLPFSIALLIAFSLSISIIGQAQGDLRRRTIAITYFKDPVTVRFAGTTLRPTAHGEATVERWRKRNESEIDITIENMIPAFNYGADYTTYVLWAITPAGQIDNLGEFRLSGSSARLKAATPYQTFAMIITAEPHYLVKLPSRQVVLENLAPSTAKVQVQTSEVYFTGDAGNFYKDNTVPEVAERAYNKTPVELLQARRAVQIARLADAERYAPEDFNQAVNLLGQAEDLYRRGANVHETGRVSRDSISLAERAREVSEERAVAAERRAEIARRDAEVRKATATATDLGERLSDTEARLKAAELARTDIGNQLDRAMRDGAEARAENRQLRSENDRLRAEVDRLTQSLNDSQAKIQELQSQNSAASAKLNENTSRLDAIEHAERERRTVEARRRSFEELRASVGGILTIKPNANGFVAVIPDTLFITNQPTLHLRAKAKMEALGQALAAHKEIAVFTIEGHADQRANADEFAMARAQAVADYLAAFGLPSANYKVESRGATMPVSTQRTLAARAANRRVELVFVSPN
ncbi:MAG TPA: OmpA family protein [Blastocatellia bacterium]|nr:OmpA family protein [Blastocatellia bacterium]